MIRVCEAHEPSYLKYILSYPSSSQLSVYDSSSSISISIGIGISISSSILVSYNVSRSNEPLLPVPKRKIRPEEEKPGGSEHQDRKSVV